MKEGDIHWPSEVSIRSFKVSNVDDGVYECIAT